MQLPGVHLLNASPPASCTAETLCSRQNDFTEDGRLNYRAAVPRPDPRFITMPSAAARTFG